MNDELEQRLRAYGSTIDAATETDLAERHEHVAETGASHLDRRPRRTVAVTAVLAIAALATAGVVTIAHRSHTTFDAPSTTSIPTTSSTLVRQPDCALGTLAQQQLCKRVRAGAGGSVPALEFQNACRQTLAAAMAAEAAPIDKVASVVHGIIDPEVQQLIVRDPGNVYTMFQNLAAEIIAGKAPQIIHSLGRSLCIYSPPAYWQWLESLPTLTDVQAAIVPLSDMPKGTAQVSGVVPTVTASCTHKPIATPLASAHASYGPPSSSSVGEVVNVYSKGTAAQIMNDVREQWGCSAPADSRRYVWLASVLRVPRLSSDQASYQITEDISCDCTPTFDIIALRVNDSAVLIVTSGNGFYAPNLKATEAFARQAYTRATSKLGG